MRIKTISATYGRKLNLDDWESMELACTLWADLDEGDDATLCLEELYRTAKAQVRAQALPVLAKRELRRRSVAQEVINGLPKGLQEIAKGLIQSAMPDDVVAVLEAPKNQAEAA